MFINKIVDLYNAIIKTVDEQSSAVIFLQKGLTQYENYKNDD